MLHSIGNTACNIRPKKIKRKEESKKYLGYQPKRFTIEKIVLCAYEGENSNHRFELARLLSRFLQEQQCKKTCQFNASQLNQMLEGRYRAEIRKDHKITYSLRIKQYLAVLGE
jgi:hypothetical protein